MDINKMTAEQRAALKAQIEAEERAESQKRQDSIDAYKQMVDEFCSDTFERMKKISELLRTEKERVFAAADLLIEQKEALFKTKQDRHSNQFTTADGKYTVALGYRTNDGWDDTVDVGIAKVKEYLKSLTTTDEGAKAVDIIMKLLAKDKKGNLKASAMIQLEQHASKYGDPLFIEGVQIIRDAYRPVDSCQFISVSWKDDNGVKHNLPLSLAAMDIN
jgi:vacuolar-type H+-ATPase subunit E/Vma4